MMKQEQTMFTELYETLLKLETVEECENFLSDLCTIKEIQSMAQRLKAAKMLVEGKTYNEVIEETDISSATLARVSKCVRYGQGGYTTLIKK
jgi:TrpR-related protein YerC/YecD